jgi:hypothetical protein
MASKPKNRHRQPSHPKGARREPARSFRVVVAAHPGSELTVAPELDLVKAALLYGDKVTLISPVTTMFLRVEGLKHFTPRQQIELARRTAPALMSAGSIPEFENGIQQLDEFLQRTERGGSGGERLLRAALLQKLAPIQRSLSSVVGEIAKSAGIDELARARAKGLVEIESADPGDALDLLVSCVLSARSAQAGRMSGNSHSGRIIEAFKDKLSRHLSSGREYLIFDEAIASLTEAAIREGVFRPAKGPAGRSAQAMTASALMGRLPTFPDATVDEILDIRTELAPSLTNFRGAMVTITKTFSAATWEAGFEDDVHDAWVETVLPAVEAVEVSVRDNASLLARANGVTGLLKPNWPSLAVLGAGTLGHEPIAQALGAAGQLVPPLLQALRDRRSAVSDIRMQPFYFLYAVERSLR